VVIARLDILMKKPSTKSLKVKLWKVVSSFVKVRDKNICFTSGKKVEGSNCHCGHMFPSGSCGAVLRYHPLNLHVQSYNENINLGGNGAVYATNFIQKYGQQKFDDLMRLKQKTIKADVIFYQKLIDLYTEGDQDKIISYLESL